ncbi:N-acetylmuramoyl-L-alanine amidase amiD precursor [Tenacibaculum maritimum]|nr:N-acetylmuramoyl-L-alanine amidase amiD precursor [Tenacibaculum maritimum]CAA0145734.1 N-acetylmuramoyl-L-alanine amidase amiD precursor [Tenacibaculum maritimum]CAA0145764.1 N-acetylmuramoyl-L-alanine amidase amiD precursor [Tenacibaculum maritimum]CAA0158597.1 N-acetylmuramoyl-L-alanine amidase amiD precursor [Tenacibaculum maritimum]CAA0174066.1 N-acetylmuramoyl-L-alanine amidase amiD precursor [Tenacibaculum maritimum]
MVMKNSLFLLSLLALAISCQSIPKNITYAKKIREYKLNTDYFPSKNQDNRVRFLVLHYTVSDTPSSLKILSGNTTREVSSHYLINDKDDREIHFLVDENKRSWHAGASNWGKVNNLNFSSIGIEIVNKGFLVENGEKVFIDFPEYQVKKIATLSKNIIDRYQIKPENVIGHADITPTRKLDPGPKFPWKRLYYDYNIGAWYDYVDKDKFIKEFPLDSAHEVEFIKSVQRDFKKYGYKIEESGEWDDDTKSVIKAFQYHFRPEKHDGTLDNETWAILKALLKKYK